MRNTSFLFVFCLLGLVSLAFSSCEEHISSGEGKVSKVNVRFVLERGGNPFLLNERFNHAGREISISKVRFYVSDLVLSKNNKEAEIKEIDEVDFTTVNIDAVGAKQGVTISNLQIPTGSYDAIKFGIGVSSDLNKKKPADFAVGHPLMNDGEYWSAWNGYIFSKIEGRFNNDNNPDDLEGAFVYHIGNDPFFKSVTFSNLDINVKEGETSEITIKLDFDKLLLNTDNTALDVATTGNIHSSENQTDYVTLFANNWKKAFGL